MALSFPLNLATLANKLCADNVTVELRRFDELSGSGNGQIWAAQLAPPLWAVSQPILAHRIADAREINAKINALDGSQKALLWSPPRYQPAAGPASLDGVTISSISATRGQISLAGLPASRVVTAGDYLSVIYSGRYYFGQFAETATASGSGNLASVEIRPYLPTGVTTGLTVELAKPRMLAIIPPGGFTPFTIYRDRWGSGASIELIQKP